MTRSGVLLPALALAAAALLLAGCGTGGLAAEGDTARGKTLFVEKCAGCHTLAGAGTSGTIGPNLDDAFAGPRCEGFAESSIRNVVQGQILYPVSNPSGVLEAGGKPARAPGMPAKLVTGNDAEAVASYVASVAGKGADCEGAAPPTGTQATATTAPPAAATTGPAATTQAPPAPAGDLAAGKTVFGQAGCAACHTLADAGASGTVGPDLDRSKPDRALVTDRVTNGKGTMPPFKGQLSDAQIEAVAAYVSAVAGK